MKKETIIALLHGPDQPGLVAKASSWIFERGSNIDHADQHKDPEANVFFQRVEWVPSGDPEQEAEAFKAFAESSLQMNTQVVLNTKKPKVALFVSKIDHCFHDIILRFQANEMSGELACIISNHKVLEKAAQTYGIPFYHTPFENADKSTVEAEQVKILKKHAVELVILARYMQILSSDFLNQAGVPVINIHHSFLPAFAGGKPYHQAYERGVKIIGATAHYANADLDEGPIIYQDVTQINHRNTISDLIRKGKDLEKSVFAHAVRLHLNNRILVYNNKTVVFD
ncbi:MAG: formyltetrahydrofolate deformylase [Coraliomargaritaceae bacterium]